MESANWSELSEDILELILAWLDLAGHARFSTVCRWWKSVADSARLSSAMNKPLSMVNSNNRPLMVRRFMSPFLTLWNGAIIVGSFEEWLILFKGTTLILLNPATGETPILLPAPRRFRTLAPCTKEPQADKVILSSPPKSSAVKCTIFFKDSIGSLYSCKLGDVTWTSYYGGIIWDVAFNKNLLYIIDDKGSLKVLDSELKSDPVDFLGDLPSRRYGYLVNASDKLFVLTMCYNSRNIAVRYTGGVPCCQCKLTGIEVEELDLLTSSCKEVESLGDNILFFHPLRSHYLSAKNYPSFQSDHIYFATGPVSVRGYSMYDKSFANYSKQKRGLVFFTLFSLPHIEW